MDSFLLLFTYVFKGSRLVGSQRQIQLGLSQGIETREIILRSRTRKLNRFDPVLFDFWLENQSTQLRSRTISILSRQAMLICFQT